jgi:hypothetical protein
MNSKNLLETGFSECLALKNITFANLPQDKGSVIVIVDQELSGKPESDILYIGRTKKPLKRILGGYLAGYGGKNTKKINNMLLNEGYIEKAAISWMLTEKPRIMQEELLAKFKKDHGELPIWNTKKKLSVKPKATAAFKPKAAPAAKHKAVAPKTVASSTTKPKTAASKKAPAKEEASTKTESTSKGETEAKPKTEMPSDSHMPT